MYNCVYVYWEYENINEKAHFIIEEITEVFQANKCITDIIMNNSNYRVLYRFSSFKQPYNRLIYSYCYQISVGTFSSFHPGDKVSSLR